MTRLEGSFLQFVDAQQSLQSGNPNIVILYELDLQGRVLQCWVRTGVEYLWGFATAATRPTEETFLTHYPYANVVDKIFKT